MALGIAEHDRLIALGRDRPRQRARAVRRADRPRRDRRRVRARERRAGRGRRRQAPDRADRRPVRGEEADGVLARAARPRACSSRCRTSARRASRRPPPRWRRRAGSGSTSTSTACRCASRAWSRSRSWSPSRRSGCCASSSRTRVDEVLAVCAKWETTATAIGEVTDSGRLRDAARRRGRRRHAGAGARRRLPALRPRAREAGAPIYPAPPRTRRDRRPARELLLALLRSANIASRRPVFEQYDCLVQSRTVRRPDEADAAVLLLPDRCRPARDRRLDRRLRPPRRVRPVPRDGRGGARVRGEPRLRRRRAARPDELPQLRQPGEAAHRVAAERGGARDGRRLPRARRAGRRRQRLALQRGPGGADLPDAGRRDGRPAARGRARRPARLRATRATRSRSSAPSSRRCRAPSWRSCAASRCPTGCPRSTSPRCDARSRSCASAVRRGEVRSAHDVAEGGFAVALAECCLAGGLGAAVDFRGVGTGGERLLELLFGEGAGGFVLSGPRPALAALAREVPTTLFGVVGSPDDGLHRCRWTATSP